MSARPEERPVAASQRPKTTVLTFAEKRRRGEKLTMLTAYDYPGAKLVDEAGVDAILVGDSLAMVVLGHPNTLSVTMDEMLHHARAVSRGASRALLIGDLPFMSYQADPHEAVRNAGRFLQEAGMDAVKLEGGRAFAETARAIVRAGIPVMGHVGLTPQSVNVMGGWRVQARTADSARALFDDALALQEAGCFAVVLESVPQRLASFVTERLEIPTIGIGAGSGTSGQVLVLHDIVGLYDRLAPKFAKRYADLATPLRAAVEAYRGEVESGAFPGREHAYAMPEEEWTAFVESLRARPLKAAQG
jgi:3-methyl-2-oxobutanoate hydroxymethyltransferase